jgi:hypothetical protein
MSFFCLHDWTPYQRSTKYWHSIRTHAGWTKIIKEYQHYYSVTRNPNGTTTHHHLLGYKLDNEFFTNDVCSKCFKLRLNLDRALAKSKKKAAKKSLATKKAADVKRRIDERKKMAREFAISYSAMKDKA